MRRMLQVFFALLCAAAGALHAGEPPSRPSASLYQVYPYVYFADEPDRCYPIEGSLYHIYVHSPDDETVTSVSFDLNLSGASITEPLVLAEGGSVDVADLSGLPYHIEASWAQKPLVHEPILTVMFPSDPRLGGFQYPSNVVFTTAAGTEVAGLGRTSMAGCCLDCFPCSFSIFADGHSLVGAGDATSIPFQWQWNCYYPGGGTLDVTDTQGWVTSWWPPSVGDDETCTVCVVPVHGGSFTVSVPDGTPTGTTSTVTISSSAGGGATVVLEVDDTIPVENTTWGAVKALYQ